LNETQVRSACYGQSGNWRGGAPGSLPPCYSLAVTYLGLSFGQGLVRSLIWNFWQTSEASQFVKNLIYFVFIFSFAMLRLWMSLAILTYGLKQSYFKRG
jgi:hypothetical protein